MVSCHGAIGEIVIFGEQIPENSIAIQAFAILRVKPHIESIISEPLYQYLISEFGLLQLVNLVTGTTAQMLAAKDLSALQIPLFPQGKLIELKNQRASY